eukprot:TRINITY_DN76697_c0_g1_i1.p1 TRINITY_DN76697_c0_g1~~TRINITY_DN76697_c0_g1_i1.p1  ORF type:complete len:288 (+),score=21.17 TRINITY_DN76697_c0_g1_i1:17-880(+)
MELPCFRWLAVCPLVASHLCTYDLAQQLETNGLAGQGFGFAANGHYVDYCKSRRSTSEECEMNCTLDAHCTGYSFYQPDHAEANSCALHMGNQWRVSLGGPQTCPSGFPLVAAFRGTENVAGARYSMGGAALTTYQKTVPTCVFVPTTTTTTVVANITNSSTRNPRDPRCTCLYYDRHTGGDDILKTRKEACEKDSLCNWEGKIGSMLTEWTGCCYAKDGGTSHMGNIGCSGSGCCRSVPEDVDCSQEWLDSIKASVSRASTVTSATCLRVVMLALRLWFWDMLSTT